MAYPAGAAAGAGSRQHDDAWHAACSARASVTEYLPNFPPWCCAAYFGVYEVLKNALAQWQGVPVSQLGPVPLMTAGGLGGAAFWVLVYPVDVSGPAGGQCLALHRQQLRVNCLSAPGAAIQASIHLARQPNTVLLCYAALTPPAGGQVQAADAKHFRARPLHRHVGLRAAAVPDGGLAGPVAWLHTLLHSLHPRQLCCIPDV